MHIYDSNGDNFYPINQNIPLRVLSKSCIQNLSIDVLIMGQRCWEPYYWPWILNQLKHVFKNCRAKYAALGIKKPLDGSAFPGWKITRIDHQKYFYWLVQFATGFHLGPVTPPCAEKASFQRECPSCWVVTTMVIFPPSSLNAIYWIVFNQRFSYSQVSMPSDSCTKRSSVAPFLGTCFEGHSQRNDTC